jgi:hypothetical protein
MTHFSQDEFQQKRADGAALRPLSSLQIRTLILMAKEAFAYLVERGDLGDSAEFDQWRHTQCLQVTERPGLSQARNEDFLPLKAHFLRLMGRDKEADQAQARSDVEPRTWAIKALERAQADLTKAAQAAGIQMDAAEYAAGAIRNRFGHGVAEAETKALWWAVNVLKRKAGQLRSQGTGDRSQG